MHDESVDVEYFKKKVDQGMMTPAERQQELVDNAIVIYRLIRLPEQPHDDQNG